jgi:hypothetical protein
MLMAKAGTSDKRTVKVKADALIDKKLFASSNRQMITVRKSHQRAKRAGPLEAGGGPAAQEKRRLAMLGLLAWIMPLLSRLSI